MPALDHPQRTFLESISRLVYCNPFTPERIELERAALGTDFDEAGADWNLRPDPEEHRPNVDRMVERAETVCAGMRTHLAAQPGTAELGDLTLYEDAMLFVLYHEFRDRLSQLYAHAPPADDATRPVPFHDSFMARVRETLGPPDLDLPQPLDPPHLLALFFQIRRAFHHIHRYIVGASPSVARLRAQVWQSIFTHDLARYRRVLSSRMGEFTTLITGPSGTGKELVARAIALSRYIPYHSRKRCFLGDPESSFHALNLSALPTTLVESELFGHRRGAFTGAIADHQGCLSLCPPEGTVFLDEIGDLDPTVQVKLLRVLQTRDFQPLGATSAETFRGKLMAATNRDLPEALREGSLREDFYYRICADTITTPALSQRLRETPDELRLLLRHIAIRLVGPDEARGLALEVEQWIAAQLPPGYPWPGNVRELEQCAQNILVRGSYHPLAGPRESGAAALVQMIQRRSVSAEELLREYCTWVYAGCGSYVEAARILGLDRRTVRARVDEERLRQLQGGAWGPG